MSTADAPATAPSRPAKLGLRRKIKAYVALTKPRVIELLLVSTLPTMIYAERGFPSIGLILATLVGGAFAAGSAGAFNCYIDRDIDRLMRRTENRPLVTGEVTPREALVFSWVLGIASLAILWFGANPLSAVLGAGAIFFYVVVYTLVLKRRTAQNIVWGGAAGCFPVLIAWSAVTNTIEWPAVILFLVIFLWTPPHYWPLSMRYGEDYRNAQVPMLGAVAGAKIVAVQVVLYAWAMVMASLLLVPLGHAGWVYTLTALASGAWFLYESHALYARAQREEIQDKKAMKVFHGSISYLTLLFLALAVDPFVGGPLLG
ncbi:Protoheme IX farnesyltransferase [Sinomonas atrocyanea]|uniref:Protoheme IX farnesyltransferase n=1 Tax=Sinomonas atrocyanea TaxID=37927 RepID=A0A127A1G0_9MICC|nr:heme o synthase [Sinomonas atrocyanea]AMM32644.1 Protoheme IX farnesyltransferase [Sinomonas atrocyanea]GEB62681.1 protoheme IX farnesyltransferase [Sinomonas atrocyanea]GGG54146.1 protoheme IX farnesyltransferase [Sinomonas atrocyanea]